MRELIVKELDFVLFAGGDMSPVEGAAELVADIDDGVYLDSYGNLVNVANGTSAMIWSGFTSCFNVEPVDGSSRDQDPQTDESWSMTETVETTTTDGSVSETLFLKSLAALSGHVTLEDIDSNV